MRFKLLGFFLAVPFVVFAYANPGAPKGFVNDFAGMLTGEQIAALEGRLSGFEKETSNEIAVATIPSLGGDTLENFAVRLFEDWKIGKEGKDNGVLILVARDDRMVRFEVGYGLEGALTDAQSAWIIDNEIVPRFRDGKYFEGLSGAVERIMGATRGEYVPSANSSSRGTLSEVSSYLAIPIFFALSILLHLFGRTRSWWLGGVLGGATGIILGLIAWSLYLGIGAFVVLVPLGLLIDFWASRAYSHKQTHGVFPWWWGGHGGSGHGGGGFGGFGGGHSGGGGASRSW